MTAPIVWTGDLRWRPVIHCNAPAPGQHTLTMALAVMGDPVAFNTDLLCKGDTVRVTVEIVPGETPRPGRED
jgi:hypothetical protein